MSQLSIIMRIGIIFYVDVEEELPPKMPEPRGNVVRTSAFVDANHSGNVVTR